MSRFRQIKGKKLFWTLLISVIFLCVFVMSNFARSYPGRATTGDEPNYEIMAFSLIRDGDLDIKNQFDSQDYVGYVYSQPIGPQINTNIFNEHSSRWYSIHDFGLPLLVAPFVAWGYTAGAAECLILVGVIMLYLAYRWAYMLTKDRISSLIATMALFGSVAYISSAGAVFPDIPTAALLLFSLILVHAKWSKYESLKYAAVGLALSGLIYLHTKNGLMAVTLATLLLVQVYRNNPVRIAHRYSAAFVFPLFILGLIFTYFIHKWYGTWIVTQPFTNGQMFYFPPGPALLASFYDASKGIFSHNPAWLFVFVGLPIWWKLHRQSLINVLIIVVPSLVIQSTFSDWSGGYAPPGRYLMNTWPLFIPALAFFIQYTKTVLSRVCFGAILSIQLILAAYYVLYKLVWWPAGERSPLFVMIENHKHIKLDSLFPNFGHELNLASLLDWVYLGLWLGLSLVLVFWGRQIAKATHSSKTF